MLDLLKLIPQLMKSRTMLINAASLIVAVGQTLAEQPLLTAQAATILAVVNVANMVLRVLTQTSVFQKQTLLTSK
jgi:hypothetical protein